eukprot:scaffold182_cov350-Prasinococcus_capsulatus_cf.AAC.11
MALRAVKQAVALCRTSWMLLVYSKAVFLGDLRFPSHRCTWVDPACDNRVVCVCTIIIGPRLAAAPTPAGWPAGCAGKPAHQAPIEMRPRAVRRSPVGNVVWALSACAR